MAAENYWFRRHEVAYAFGALFATGRTVLDIGCGEGYGSAVLARSARRVIGVDYDAVTAAHAGSAYPSIDVLRANLAALPVRTDCVDLLVCLQVVEHVWNHVEFLTGCRRVLRRDGSFVLSTPNRLTFSPGLDRPVNPFHTVEFTAAELVGLLTACGFEIAAVHGVHRGPRLRELDERYGSFVDVQLAQPPGDWSDGLREAVASVTVADFTVRPAEAVDIDEALDLVVLARPA